MTKSMSIYTLLMIILLISTGIPNGKAHCVVKPSVIAPEGICSILDGQDRILATVFAFRLKDMPAGNVTHMFSSSVWILPTWVNLIDEMEVDRDFPKLIALDDKQGIIYLIKGLNKNAKAVPYFHTNLVADQQLLYVTLTTSTKCQDTQDTKNTTISSTSRIYEDNQLALPSLAKTFSPLVNLQSAPTSTPIVDP
ncbi:hypothetical protein F2Q69_00014647 [Brassica cretica]|uniref:DUF1618 domain-containing protein n=1 Tax=Brassica cretica TaxID=69181 RepID=A0A8S9R7M8_BRACR|nr:hypothetical protein F2Q69_00014647 [Brassica cretica]